MSLTVEEIKKKKIELESAILKLVQEYEKETDTFVSYISFERRLSKEDKKYVESPLPEVNKDGPVENINVDMRFDL